MNFVHLHNHSEYSVLDGMSTTKGMIARAKELGMPAMALTDHGHMLGILDFVTTAKAEGIKPIVGIETYMAARRMTDRDPALDRKSAHQLLLAESMEGYHNLVQLASAAQLEGFYYYPRIDLPLLEQYCGGIIATSGCFGGLIPTALRNNDTKRANELIRWYLDHFGDRFYIELQDHNVPGLRDVNKQLVKLAQNYGIKLIATNDAHYVKQSDAPLQNVLLAVNTGAKLDDEGRFSMDDNTYYLRSTEEMGVLFAETPEAVTNTLEIAERCNVDLHSNGYLLPKYPVPDSYTAETYLRELCEEGLKNRYGSGLDDTKNDRLNYELGIIHQMGFDDYFLIVWDLVNTARSKGILYNARGSAAGSIVAYGLGITSICPLKFKLIFERFLNPERISMPDIDLDFQDDRRGEMMAYTAQKYGDDRVASIITYGRMQARAAVRGVGRALGIDLTKINRISKLIPGAPANPTLSEAVEQIPDLQKAMTEDPEVKRLIETAIPLEGTVQSLGTHAAGIVIAPSPLTDYVALHRTTSKDENVPVKKVVQLDMAGVEKMGLLKVDFLGLSTLTVIQRALDLIEKRHGIKMALGDIPLDDKETYALLSAGDTTAVFQFESAGMKKYLREMKPDTLENIIAMVALYRPGPMDFIPSYIKRMHGEEEITYHHPKQAEIFDDTYGIPIYQEQIMFAAVKLAGYTQGQADELRKAISKKNAEKIAKHKEKFIKGAAERDIPQKVAEDIFTDWENFARYGFNRAHAAAYGVVAVRTAWLKHHYPVEFFTAILSVFRDDQKKTINYMADCRAHGIQILPPDINQSQMDFSIEDTDKGPAIRFGLTAIKNAGNAVRELIASRGELPFSPIEDFVERVNLTALGKKALESLAKAGAFSAFGTRRQILAAIPEMQREGKRREKAGSSQMRLEDAGMQIQKDFALVEVDETGADIQNLDWEKELIGVYLTGHPLESINPEIYATHYTDDLVNTPAGKEVTLVVLLTEIKPYTTKTGKPMAFLKAGDLHGDVEMVAFPNQWQAVSGLLREGGIYIVDGKVEGSDEEEERAPKIIIDRMVEFATDVNRPAQPQRSVQKIIKAPQSLPAALEKRSPRTVVVMVPSGATPNQLSNIVTDSMTYPGPDHLAVVVEGEGQTLRVDFAKGIGLNDTLRDSLTNIRKDLEIIEFDPEEKEAHE